MPHRRFAHRVGRDILERSIVVQGTDVDLAAGSLLDDLLSHGLREQELALQVGVHDEIIVLLADLHRGLAAIHASHVDQGVDPAELGDDGWATRSIACRWVTSQTSGTTGRSSTEISVAVRCKVRSARP